MVYWKFSHWQSHFMQENTCLIDGNCYAYGEINPEDPSQSCNATRNATVWSDIGQTLWCIRIMWLSIQSLMEGSAKLGYKILIFNPFCSNCRQLCVTEQHHHTGSLLNFKCVRCTKLMQNPYLVKSYECITGRCNSKEYWMTTLIIITPNIVIIKHNEIQSAFMKLFTSENSCRSRLNLPSWFYLTGAGSPG